MLRDDLANIRIVTYPDTGKPVERSVAEAIAGELAPSARVGPDSSVTPGESASRLGVAIADSQARHVRTGSWMHFQLQPGGPGRLEASDAHWLYAVFCLLRDDWLDQESGEFAGGRTIRPTYPWLRNLSDFFVGSLRHSRHFCREGYIRQLARQGFSHVSINGLGVDRPFESGPPGDVYWWFYDYSPDLDQFVDSTLLRGYYPPDYLQANLNHLKANAALASKYGLVPGLHINSPRSMPEEFWQRYGFLRGARVDHPRESFRPRYTLAMAHPTVQDHYRQMMRKIMHEVPEIGFIHVWTNDSGAGFEFVTSLYAGRNGGPYLIREWKSEDEIARAAAGNVLTYYRLLRDEGCRVNPDFRLICDLAPFYAERKYIVPELGDNIDAGEFGSFAEALSEAEQAALNEAGAMTHLKADIGDNNVIGVPFPLLVHERLLQAFKNGTRVLLATSTPHSLAPYDINGEVLRAVQLSPERPLEEVLASCAKRWGGGDHADALIELWRLSDAAVRAYPAGVPLGTFAFPWFRLWVRPFVPNIDALPEDERAYYERFLLATFNNPARVDLNNDMMWNFLSAGGAGEKKSGIDAAVFPPLARAIEQCAGLLDRLSGENRVRAVFLDLHDRLLAARSYFFTMRNMLAWIEGVHGYLEAGTPEEKNRCRALSHDMANRELENAKSLLSLWQHSTTDFMPVSLVGETIHSYGENFGELLEKKIRLMEQHLDDEPYIDPAYMWRMPRGAPFTTA